MRHPIPQAAITLNPETQKFGLVVWMPGKKPHYALFEVFATLKDALRYLDPHGERFWEDPLSDDDSIVMFSQRYKYGVAPTADIWKQLTR
jgi:hypothetical protein